MSNENKPCCKEKVDALIANKGTHWTEDDREWLLSQDENAIDKMAPKQPAGVQPIQVNAEEVLQEFKDGLKTPEDFLALMPEAMREQFKSGMTAYKANREALVKGIMDNAKDAWTKDALEALSDATLESISKSIKQPANYSGQGPLAHSGNGQSDEKLLPPGIGVKKEG